MADQPTPEWEAETLPGEFCNQEPESELQCSIARAICLPGQLAYERCYAPPVGGPAPSSSGVHPAVRPQGGARAPAGAVVPWISIPLGTCEPRRSLFVLNACGDPTRLPAGASIVQLSGCGCTVCK